MTDVLTNGIERFESLAANAGGTTLILAVAGSSPVNARKSVVAQLVELEKCFTDPLSQQGLQSNGFQFDANARMTTWFAAGFDSQFRQLNAAMSCHSCRVFYVE